jgi:hypothetical protein
MTPLSLTSYANVNVPSGTLLGGQINGVFFHSGGASFNDPVGNPGTPAALLQLSGGIASHARSGSNVMGSLEINSTTLDLTQFVEIVFTDTLKDRVGVWLNPTLGNVTISAFGATGNSLESGTGTAGNFVGFQRATSDIKFISIVGGPNRFTVDDLTYGTSTTSTPGAAAAPEPGTLALIGMIGFPVIGSIVRRKLRR